MRFLGNAAVAALMLGAVPLSAASAKGGTPPPAAALDDVKIAYKSFTLPNGLTAIVYSDHSAPNIYLSVRYRIGSADEPADRTGFAHLFEHLMFQPTAHRSGDFVAAMSALGATGTNGMTTTDSTTYQETIPSNALDRALWLESDRMGYLIGGLTQQLLDQQREVVKNEKRQGELAPGQIANARFLANYYPAGHPYSHTVIGTMEDIDRATLDDVGGWFADNYGASNAVIVLAGDVDFETAKAKITHYFGDVRTGKPRSHLAQWVPGFPQIKRDVVYENVPVTSLSRTWPLANTPRENTLAQLAAITLAEPGVSPLFRALVEEKKVALGVDARVTENLLSSQLTLSVALRPGVTREDGDRAIDAALADYLLKGPDPARLKAVASSTNSALMRALESNAAIGSFLLDGYTIHDDPQFFLHQRDWTREATSAAVTAVARAILRQPYYEMTQLPTPPADAAKGAIAGRAVDRSRMPPLGTVASTLPFPAIAEKTLPNGLKVVVARRGRLPLVDARLVFDTGTLADAAYAPGAAEQALGLLATGTKRRDAKAMRAAFARLDANVSAYTGERQATLGWTASKANFAPSLALIAEVVREPSYPQLELDDRARDSDSRFDALERNPSAAAPALFARAIWGERSPQGRIPSRTDPKASRDELLRFHDAEMGPNKATLYLVGDIDLNEASLLAERYLGDWQRVTPPPIATPAIPTAGQGRVILVDAPGAPQSSIVVGQAISPYDKAMAAADSLADAALGGRPNGRLYVDLRDTKGWSYGFASSLSTATAGPRVFTASGAVKGDRTAQSMAAIRDDIAAFVSTQTMTQAELDREKAASIQSIPSGYANNAAYLTAISSAGALGLPYDRSASSIDRIAHVTLDDVHRAATKNYRPAELTWLVVGDLRLIEKDVRALGFGSVEIWDVYGRRVR